MLRFKELTYWGKNEWVISAKGNHRVLEKKYRRVMLAVSRASLGVGFKIDKGNRKGHLCLRFTPQDYTTRQALDKRRVKLNRKEAETRTWESRA